MEKGSGVSINYSLLSICQYVMAIFVILVHAQNLFPTEGLHFIQKSIFGRMAVPFFVMCSAYFFAYQKETKQKSLISLLKNMGKSYLFWSIVYLPYAFLYFEHLQIQRQWMLPGLLVAFLYTGTCYHLWYLPAVISGFSFLTLLKKLFSQKVVFLILCVLYFFGSIETYSAYLDGTSIYRIFDSYISIFFTTRNGLFFTPMFLFLGEKVYQWRDREILQKNADRKALLSFLLFMLEGWIIFVNQGIDKNFFLSLIPFTFFFFNAVIRSQLWKEKDFRIFKKLSIYYFFLHPIFIEMTFYLLRNSTLVSWQKGVVVSLLTLIFTHVCSLGIIVYQKKIQRKRG